MPSISVRHALGRYEVQVEPGALRSLEDRIAAAFGGAGRPLALITDDTVGQLYDRWSDPTVPPGQPAVRLRPTARFGFPAGEDHKTRETWQRLSDEMLARGLDRRAVVVALGGGVVGDVAGFVAATFLRGVPVVQAPTTLLAMLDAAVGGKVGVDTPAGKNLIGAFHPPALVVADPLTLRTLPERTYRAGLAEAVKHGLIADAAYFGWIAASAAALGARDLEALTRLVARSVELKAEVVAEDERETGRRATLNAGHTVAHGLEHASGYALPHGEAVALGLVAECRIAERLGVAPAGLAAEVSSALAALDLPVRLAAPPALDRVVSAMRHDKKNQAGAFRLALAGGVGRMHREGGGWTTEVPEALLLEGLTSLA